MKWDGQYVAGVSKVSALKRTTEIVEHREGGDPSTSRKSPGRTKFDAIKVLVDTRYVAEDVLADATAALLAAFSFEQRSFGQPVAKSEVLGVIQGVDGVVAVDLDCFYPTGGPKDLPFALLASRARWQLDAIVPAEMLIVNADGIVLTEMS